MHVWVVYVLRSSDRNLLTIKDLVSGYSHRRLKMRMPEIYLEILLYKTLRQPGVSAELV